MNYELMHPLQPANFQTRMLDQEKLLLKASPNGPRLYDNFRTRAMYKSVLTSSSLWKTREEQKHCAFLQPQRRKSKNRGSMATLTYFCK